MLPAFVSIFTSSVNCYVPPFTPITLARPRVGSAQVVALAVDEQSNSLENDMTQAPEQRHIIAISSGRNAELLAAVGQRRKKITRSIGHERALIAQRTDPLPLMVAAAIIAATGPALIRMLRNVPRIFKSSRPKLRGLDAARAAARSARPDGALEDERLETEARALLETWREGDDMDEMGLSADVREAALGAAMLDWATKAADNAAALEEICGPLLKRATQGSDSPVQVYLSALRKACTAAARQTLGKGRASSTALLAASLKEERCGSFLTLQRALTHAAPASEQEAQAAAAGVRSQITLAFGLEGLDERAEALRLSVIGRLVRLEARRALKASEPTNPAAALDVVLTPLLPLLDMEGSDVAKILLEEARDLMQAHLESALAAWVAERPVEAVEWARLATKLTIACLCAQGGTHSALTSTELELVRNVGLTSTSRFGLYGGFACAALVEEIRALHRGAQPTYGAQDATVLRRLLRVLPASAEAAEKAALAAAAADPAASNIPRENLVGLGASLGLRRDQARRVLDEMD